MRAKYFLHSIKAGKHTNTAFNIIHNNTSRSFIVSFAWRNLSDSWTLKINWRKGEGAFSSRPRRNKGFYFLSYKLLVQNIICSILLKIAPNRKKKQKKHFYPQKENHKTFIWCCQPNSAQSTRVFEFWWNRNSRHSMTACGPNRIRLRHIRKWNLTI